MRWIYRRNVVRQNKPKYYNIIRWRIGGLIFGRSIQLRRNSDQRWEVYGYKDAFTRGWCALLDFRMDIFNPLTKYILHYDELVTELASKTVAGDRVYLHPGVNPGVYVQFDGKWWFDPHNGDKIISMKTVLECAIVITREKIDYVNKHPDENWSGNYKDRLTKILIEQKKKYKS